MLHEFITLNRVEIVRRCRAKVATSSVPPPTKAEIDHGVPLFLDQLVDALRLGQSGSADIANSALHMGTTFCAEGSRSHKSCMTMATFVSPSRNSPLKQTRPSAPMTFAC